jgi:RNA polymerase sigma factor (sigma-70 family)
MSAVAEAVVSGATSAPHAAFAAQGREPDPWLARQVRGAVLHALVLHEERRRPELVEDLIQDVWCRLLERRALERCRAIDQETRRRYLRRIAESVVVDHLRASGARKRRPPRLVPLGSVRRELERRYERADSPERRAIARERLRTLVALCREVVGQGTRPERLRVARWALIEGRPSREIALGLGGSWSVVAIDSYVSRLRRRLGRHGIVLPFRPRGRAAR